MFLLVPAYPGCPGQTAVKWLVNLQAVIIHSSDAVFWSERGSLCVAEHYRVTTHPCSDTVLLMLLLGN